MAFVGALTLSLMARATTDRERAKHALKQGEDALRQGCLSHSQLHFYRHAIDVSLRWHDWSDATRYAEMLERFVQPEPLPWATLLLERARVLIALGSGGSGDVLQGRLQRIREEITQVGFWSALPADSALGQVEA
jgi:hypothetical protein